MPGGVLGAAWIQGICTVTAASIAVAGALLSVNSWRKEAPGRRRLEVAEKCLVSAIKVFAEMIEFGYDVGRYMNADLRPTFRVKPVSNEKVEASKNKVCASLEELKSLTELADMYYGDYVKGGYDLYNSCYNDINGAYKDFRTHLVNRQYTEGARRKIRDEFYPKPRLAPHHKKCTAALAYYREKLQPSLGILAKQLSSETRRERKRSILAEFEADIPDGANDQQKV